MKIICVGRNYAAHTAELNNEQAKEPVLFMKPDTALLNKGFPFVVPEFSQNVHFELEVVVKINKVGKHIQPKFAHKYYDMLSVGIDFTARDLQEQLKADGLPWERAKAFDNSAVVGTFVSKTQFQEVQKLSFSMNKNGEVVQKGHTSEMLYGIDELIAYISQYFTLKTGDLIFTGTPAGVGAVASKDVLEGFLEGESLFVIDVL